MAESLRWSMANGNGERCSSLSPDRKSSSPSQPSSPSSSCVEVGGIRSMRSIEWKINLGVLPANASSIEELRRAAANGRRRYAELRRHLLVDPHIKEESQKSANLTMDNPLSQNPESVWGRFFRNAELERTIDNDLSRLYPEHGSYFQTTACQAMLRRILLLRALRYPEHSYRQGMHELLAPLLYVLHVDAMHLSQLKHMYGDLFDDRFEDLSFQENNSTLRNDIAKRNSALLFGKTSMKIEDEDKSMDNILSFDNFGCESNLAKFGSSDELDPDVMSIVLSSDAYGAEGELGALLSVRFMEHDAYSMFDALLSGQGGAVAMADYFMSSPAVYSVAGLPPVIEASSDLYNLLAVADISLYNHLVELGVEPQYFALRWLRVLFGREFELDDLLLVWDAIFEASNSPLPSWGDEVPWSSIPYSPRSAFVSAMSVTLLLHLRSSLLSTSNATTCLQKLLNFPKNADVKKLTKKAKLLQAMALDKNASTPPPLRKIGQRNFDDVRNSPFSCRILVLSDKVSALQLQLSNTRSPDGLQFSMPESYWEQKWRNSILQKVIYEESFGQSMEWPGKALSGQADAKNSTDASCEDQILSNSASGMEVQEIEKKNCFVLSNAEQDLVSNNMDTKHRSETCSVRSARKKLLDSDFEIKDFPGKRNVNKFCLIKESDASTTNQSHCNGTDFSNRNGIDLDDSTNGKCNNVNKSVDGHAMTCSDRVKKLNFDSLSDERNKCLSKLSSDKAKLKETNAVTLDLDAHLECSRISDCGEDSLNIAVKVEIQCTEGGYMQPCPESPSQIPSEYVPEESSSKATTSGYSKIAGNLDSTKNQKHSAAAFFGKFRSIWNIFRNSSIEKSTGELSKTKAEDSSVSDGKKGLSEKRTITEEKSSFPVLSAPLIHENDRGNFPCVTDNDGNQMSGVCVNDDDQASCTSESNQPSFVYEHDKNHSLQVCENEIDKPSHVSGEGDRHSLNWDVQNANTANSIVSKSLNNSELSVLPKDNNMAANLQILGQSMLENIQVIESTVLQTCTTQNKSEGHVTSIEKSEVSRNFIAGRGQHAALVALTELRKISNILSHM